MRQTYIVALLSAVVIGDDWLTNPTTDEVIAHLYYDWTVPVTDEERARHRKEMETASKQEEIELANTVDSLSEYVSLTINYGGDKLFTGTTGKSSMKTEWEMFFGADNKLKKSVFLDEDT